MKGLTGHRHPGADQQRDRRRGRRVGTRRGTRRLGRVRRPGGGGGTGGTGGAAAPRPSSRAPATAAAGATGAGSGDRGPSGGAGAPAVAHRRRRRHVRRRTTATRRVEPPAAADAAGEQAEPRDARWPASTTPSGAAGQSAGDAGRPRPRPPRLRSATAPASAGIDRDTTVDVAAQRLARDLAAIPGIERFGALRLGELDRAGPRPLRTMWRIARDELGRAVRRDDDRRDHRSLGAAAASAGQA